MKKKVFFACFIFAMLFIFNSSPSNADVIAIKAEGVVNGVMSDFISKNINYAAGKNAELLVIELDTPGGLASSMEKIVKSINASEVPVAVYVSPGGAKAASAGVFITLSAHIAAMAPGTNIGAAHPVNIGGEKMDKTMAEKVVNDASAYIKSIAEKRGRNSEWAEKAVRESVSITNEEALKLNVIDIVAPNLDSLLQTIDGRTVETSIGKHVIKTSGIKVERQEMGLRLKILNIISNPNVAYLLMLLGFYGIFFEFTSPGAIFPGVFGSISLILALYAFQPDILPVNWAGLILIIIAIIMFILEVKIISHGALTIGGIIAMIMGSLMLFESPEPFLSASLKVIIPAVLVTALFFIFTISLALKAYRRKPQTGAEGLIGYEGEAKTDVHATGQVFVHGEIWSAWSDEPVKAGEKITVEKVENLKLKVRKA